MGNQQIIQIPKVSRGRKMKPGRIIYDSSNGRVCVFVTYCDRCHGKVCLPKMDLPEFLKSYNKNKKSLTVRMAQAALKKLAEE